MAQWFFEPRHTAAESGPLMHRVDIHIDEPATNYRELRGTVAQKSSANVRARIVNDESPA